MFLLTVENHPIAVALNPGFVADEGLRKVVNGYVYAVGAKLVFDDRGDDFPIAAGKAGADSWHVNGCLVFECSQADSHEPLAERIVANWLWI